LPKILNRLFALLPRLWGNWISLLGSVVASIAAITILTALAIDLTSTRLNAYAAAILFLVVPTLFALGLALIPIGLLRERRRGASPPPDSIEAGLSRAFDSATMRRRVAFVVFMTALNVLIFSLVTYHSVTFMETPRFCGTTCHSVMQPEFDAYQQSPHSHVACVDCHIGSGAASTLEAKLNGLHQVWGAVTRRFSRPIPTPVRNLPPASETCSGCHHLGLTGDRLAFRVHFKDDEGNTPQVTAMLMHVGGRDPRTDEWSGIHFHASERHKIRFEVLDEKRQDVGKIQELDGERVVKEWLPPKERAGAAVREVRTMDCTDCHNRATHVYDGTPAAAVEKALATGRLDRKVPWLRHAAVAALESGKPARGDADSYFRRALADSYDREHAAARPAPAALDAAAAELAKIYLRNVYPDLNLGWNNYPSLIGHSGPDPGDTKAQCFRCHAGDHQTAEGQALGGQCEQCHEVTDKDELPTDLPDELRPLLRLP
jgi:hypothetical protein